MLRDLFPPTFKERVPVERRKLGTRWHSAGAPYSATTTAGAAAGDGTPPQRGAGWRNRANSAHDPQLARDFSPIRPLPRAVS